MFARKSKVETVPMYGPSSHGYENHIILEMNMMIVIMDLIEILMMTMITTIIINIMIMMKTMLNHHVKPKSERRARRKNLINDDIDSRDNNYDETTIRNDEEQDLAT